MGGYVAALLCQTARTYLALTRPSTKPPQPDPINSHFQLFSPSSPGPVHLIVSLLKPGFRISIVQIEIQEPITSANPRDEAKYKTCALAIVTMGNLSLGVGLSLPTEPTVKKEDIPNRDRDCKRWTVEDDPVMAEINLRSPVNHKFQNWILKGTKDGMFNDRFGLSVREMWLRRSNGKGFDIMSLVAICDFVCAYPPPLLAVKPFLLLL
jgi:hypothetical protein